MSFGLNNDIFTKKFTSQGTYQTEEDVRSIINQYFPNTIRNYSEINTIPDLNTYSVPLSSSNPSEENKRITIKNLTNSIVGTSGGIGVSSNGKLILNKAIVKRYGTSTSPGISAVENELVYFDSYSGVSYLGLCIGDGGSWLGVSIHNIP